MGQVLRTNVHVTDPEHPERVTVLRAGESVPAKFKKFVTNPKAFIDDGASASKSTKAQKDTPDETADDDESDDESEA